MYNVAFTVLPPLVIGVFDQFVSARILDRYPQLYMLGQKNAFFTKTAFWLWVGNALYHSLVSENGATGDAFGAYTSAVGSIRFLGGPILGRFKAIDWIRFRSLGLGYNAVPRRAPHRPWKGCPGVRVRATVALLYSWY